MYLPEGQIIAIIRGVAEEQVAFVVEALLQSGIDHAEVSLSNVDEGLACIKKLNAAFGRNLGLGVGTVTTPELMDRAVQAGAGYIITPAWDDGLARKALNDKLPIFPGVFSPAEVMAALNLGITQLKLFPAAALGARYLKDLRGPFPKAEFIGVGGVNCANLADFWKAGCTRFAVGSDLVPAGSGKDNAAAIAAKAAEYMQIITDLRSQG